MKLTSIAAGVLGSALMVAGLSVPAHAAASGVSISVQNGVVGVSQNVSATVTDINVGGGYGTLSFTGNGVSLGTANVGLDVGETGSVAWVPNAAGDGINVGVTFSPSGGGDPINDSTSVRISKVNTQGSVTTPGSAPTSTQVTLSATVRAQTGSYVPTGNVTFYTGDGNSIGSSNLDGNGRAQISYATPGSPGNVTVYVIYNGDANANASKRSSSDTLKVVQGTPTVSLVAPQTNYVGSPVQLTAKINPPSGSGTVTFSANNTNLGQAGVSNGVATITWNPPSTGKFTLKANYSGGNGVAGGTATNDVMVNLPLKPDQITVNPAGAPGPWPAGSTQGLANGAQVQLNASSASGAPVTITATNPCSMNGNVLVVNGVGAPCAVTASSSGGNGFAPGSVSFTVLTGVGTQTASVNPAATGTYKKGKKMMLAPVNAVTSLGKKITWKVGSGKASCKIVKAGGSFKVSLVKSGTCVVRGSAPGVAGQWAPFSVARQYTVR